MARYEDLPRDDNTRAVQAERAAFPVRYSLLSASDSTSGPRSEIELREPTALDFETIQREKTAMGRSIALLSHLLELSPDEARRLGARDYARLSVRGHLNCNDWPHGLRQHDS